MQPAELHSDSTHSPQSHMDKSGGLVRIAPHLVPDNAFYDIGGFTLRNKRIVQYGPWVYAFSTAGVCRGIAMVSINGDRTLLVFLLDTSIYYCPAGAAGWNWLTQVPWTTTSPGHYTNASPVVLSQGSAFRLWAWVSIDSELYFTDLGNVLQRFQSVNNIDTSFQTVFAAGPAIVDPAFQYAAKYAVMYANHLVLGNVKLNGSSLPLRIANSEINDFTNFTPTDVNQASFYDIYEPSQSLYGITGMGLLGQNLMVYTRDTMWQVTYVGFNNGVFTYTQVSTGLGVTFPYSLVVFKNFHYWIGDDNFYQFNGYWIQAIGDSVRDYFFAGGATQTLLEQTVGFRDRVSGELCWSFPDAVTGQQSVLMYNPNTNTWSRSAMPQVAAYVPSGQGGYVALYMLAGQTLSSLTGTQLYQLGGFAPTTYPMLGSSTVNRIATQGSPSTHVPGPNNHSIQAQAEPYLETGDMFYVNISDKKELDEIYIDASYDSATCLGIEVFLSARDLVHSPVAYKSLGLWNPSLITVKFTALRKAGRVFRFKFVFRLDKNSAFGAVSDAHFGGFAESLYNYPTEQ